MAARPALSLMMLRRRRTWRNPWRNGRPFWTLPAYLAVIFVAHVAAMMALEGMSLNDAVWLTATTIVTVGYGDLSAGTIAGRIATMALMYAGAIFVVAVAINNWLDIRSERAERKAQGAWRWNLEDHILIVGAPEHNETGFFLRLCGQIRQSEAWDEAPIELLTPCYEKAGLPQALRDLGVVHYSGRGTRQSDLLSCDVAKARGVIVLSDNETDGNSDARTFDIVHRIRESGYAGPIVAESVEDENRERLKRAGATAVVRPMRGFPEVLTRALFAPGSEQILENLFTSEGDECLLVELASPCTATWTEIVSRVVGEDLGIPIACRLQSGETRTNPPGRQSVTVTGLYVVVHDRSEARIAERISAAIGSGIRPKLKETDQPKA